MVVGRRVLVAGVVGCCGGTLGWPAGAPPAEKTIKDYVFGLLAKLGVVRRTQAAVLATRLFAKP